MARERGALKGGAETDGEGDSSEASSASPAPLATPSLSSSQSTDVVGDVLIGADAGLAIFTGCSRRALTGLFLCLVALYLNTALKDTLMLTWPLYLKRHFGWAEAEYGMLLPLQQVLFFALAATPLAQAVFGTRRCIAILGVVASLASALAYMLREPSSSVLVRGGHVSFFLVGTTAGGALELLLQSLSSTLVPPRAQGRLFALMSMIKLGGTITGNLWLAKLFQVSIDAGSGPEVLRGGALPVALLAVPVLFNLASLTFMLPSFAQESHALGVMSVPRQVVEARVKRYYGSNMGSKDSSDREDEII
uniref:Major facilitator superfamily (MFS) profile domain-containing protein n=1 Tax=Haptolina brevifila TaxID=156173 RepID=A0A6U7NB69_9EUKA|mmetsp:Transcript_84391/g.168502  ORF Transcript_84391/g.168502 Transcript_84391/m.168502 type:complete len:307 (+) Transcript_84391:991-1911(+)